MLTESETLFQRLCKKKGLLFDRIEAESGKTPDYLIKIGDTCIVVEIKEFEANTDESTTVHDISMNSGKFHTFDTQVTLGNAVRRKIKKAGPQIRRKTAGKLPSMLILYNKCLLKNPANDYEVRVAMYGFDAIVFSVSQNMTERCHAVGYKSAGNRQMTETCNTSISSVGILKQKAAYDPELTVYHNAYAAIPLSPDLIRGIAVRQFVLGSEGRKLAGIWQEV